jgi:prophage regulatory protein
LTNASRDLLQPNVNILFGFFDFKTLYVLVLTDAMVRRSTCGPWPALLTVPNDGKTPQFHQSQTASGFCPAPKRSAMQPANDNTPMLISLNDACRLTSMSRTMLNRYRAEGRFPRAVELGDRRVAFVRAEVVAWVDAKILGRAAA